LHITSIDVVRIVKVKGVLEWLETEVSEVVDNGIFLWQSIQYFVEKTRNHVVVAMKDPYLPLAY